MLTEKVYLNLGGVVFAISKTKSYTIFLITIYQDHYETHNSINRVRSNQF